MANDIKPRRQVDPFPSSVKVAPHEEQRSHTTIGPRRSHTRHKKLLLIGLPLLVLVVTGAVFYYFLNYTGPFPHNIRDQIKGVTLYYPTNLPDGLKVDRTSFRIPSKNVLIYTVTDRDGNIFHVSLQALPSNFDFSAFQNKFESSQQVTLPAGNDFIGDLGSELVSSIQTPKNTWIIINTPDVTANAELAELSHAFKPAN